ncbi:MAG: AzlD domain-containing protein [Rhodocyclaceae bacterium]|nr:AzlD domain-containing protein [Rhodocyclaceae bacterium]
MNEGTLLSGGWLWLAFVLIAVATHVPRGSFIVAGSRVRLPEALQRALRYAPAAALAALVAPDMLLVGGQLDPFNLKLVAGLAAFAVAFRWKNPWLPFAVGMGIVWLGRI